MIGLAKGFFFLSETVNHGKAETDSNNWNGGED
jgi:hypothetical protein